MVPVRYRIRRERRGGVMRWVVYVVDWMDQARVVSHWASWETAMSWVDQYVSGPRFGHVRR